MEWGNKIDIAAMRILQIIIKVIIRVAIFSITDFTKPCIFVHQNKHLIFNEREREWERWAKCSVLILCSFQRRTQAKRVQTK